MVLFARVLTEGFGGAIDQWRQVLVVARRCSRSPSAPSRAWPRSNLKRLWAYSSIANIGYALIGLAAGGAEGVQSMLIFMVLYMIDVTGFFACLAALSRDGQADGDHRRHRRPDPRAAGHRAGHDRLLALGAGPAAVLRLLGQVLCVQGGAAARACAPVAVIAAWSAAWWRPSTTCA